MKEALVSLFLFFAFPLACALDVQVLDSDGQPIFPGLHYYVVASTSDMGGGIRVAKTGNSKCPVTVIQDKNGTAYGIPSKFTIPGISTLEIFEGTPLEVKFITTKPECVKSFNWTVFVDSEIGKHYIGVGGPEDHPGQQILKGAFSFYKYKVGYKLMFCSKDSSPPCSDVRLFGSLEEDERRLILSTNDDDGVVFDVMLIQSPP
ncbi:hypothetical protein PIB30_002516 [Stylosanthes scabra]|uniref:Uncharacterized protein n=1 Tax=Stylosanthes scabra TaxID=79078 RepID=A0ABU6XZP7_9FABA|nr:hypothetical protein [Stylosanthes scabra]